MSLRLENLNHVFFYGTRLLSFHQLAVFHAKWNDDGALPQHQVTGAFEPGSQDLFRADVVAGETFLSIAVEAAPVVNERRTSVGRAR